MSIENISVKTQTLKPNGVIIGALTNNNGVISGFSSSKYMEVLNMRQTDITYIFKCTMPSTLPTSGDNCELIHSEYWEDARFIPSSGDIKTYNWEANESPTICTPTAGQTVWIKSVHGSTNYYYYYIGTNQPSSNDWTLAASFSDASRVYNKNFPFVIGNHSAERLRTRAWCGSVDLNYCSAEKNGSTVWSGMGYRDIQRIGGKEFDGQWVLNSATISSSFTLSPGGSTTLSLSSYVPNDGYDYEVMFETVATTGSSSGDYVEARYYAGTGLSGIMARGARIQTRASSTQRCSVFIVLPILASDRNITVETYSESVNTATLGVYTRGYRRIGKNGTGSNYISNIGINNSKYDIDGKFLNGYWIPKDTTLFSGTLEQSSSSTISLSDALPDDEFAYEILCSVTAVTGTSSGNYVAPRLGANTDSGNAVICNQYTRTSSSMMCAGNTIIPVKERNIYLWNSGNSTSGTITVYLRGYRRMCINA